MEYILAFTIGMFIMWLVIRSFFVVKFESKHECAFKEVLFDIEMENNTNFLIRKCVCGCLEKTRVGRTSLTYKNYLKNNGIRDKWY